MDAFTSVSSNPKLPIDEKLINRFVDIWHKYDPNATYFIPTEKLGDLLEELFKCEVSGESLFVDKKNTVFSA